MRHRIAGRHLNRTSSHRKAMRRNLAASLFEHGTVRTTLAKAKDVRPFVERLITVARKGTLHARRQVIAMLQDRAIADKEERGQLLEQTVVQKLFDEIAPRYAGRPGGYTRIIHLPERRIGDGGRQALIQLVEEHAPSGAEKDSGARSARRRRAARRAEAGKEVPTDEVAPADADEQPANEAGEPSGQRGPDEETSDDDKQAGQ